MKDVLDLVEAWHANGAEVGRAVVLRTYGSAPRPAGSVLVYSSDGRIAGNVSGGCVEGAAAEEIDNARQNGRSRTVSYGISDEQAWGVGLAGGGTIDVLIEPTVPSEALDAARRAGGIVVVTELPSDAATSTSTQRLTYAAGPGLSGSGGEATTDAVLAAAADEALLRGTSRVVEAGHRQFFLEAFATRPRL